MSDSAQSDLRVTHVFGGDRKPGWYLEGASPSDASRRPPVLTGPGTIHDMRDELQRRLGPERAGEANRIIEDGLRKHVREACADYLHSSSPAHFSALEEATARAADARSDLERNDREVLRIDTRNIEATRVPEGVEMQPHPDGSRGGVLVQARRPIDVVVTHQDPDEPIRAEFHSEHAGDLTLDGRGTGDVLRNGAGEGSAVRSGTGGGSATRFGEGYGHAIREGDGDGNAVRIGAGNGSARRSGRGTGCAERQGSGTGDAIRDGRGDGAAVVRESAKGNARREGRGDGDAWVQDSARGDAVRSGAGRGNAVVDHEAAGNAVVEESARGAAWNMSEQEGSAVNRSMSDGNAHRDGRGDGDAVRIGSGAGDAVRCNEGDGHAWRGGSGNGEAFNSAEGEGHAFHTGQGNGSAERRIGTGTTVVTGRNGNRDYITTGEANPVQAETARESLQSLMRTHGTGETAGRNTGPDMPGPDVRSPVTPPMPAGVTRGDEHGQSRNAPAW